MQSILVVEDDLNIRELLVYALNNNGFKATGFSNSKDFFNYIENSIPSLVILDLMLEGESGYDILQKMRSDSKLKDLPVIILTAKDSEFDKVKGLDMGADDYITKPFGVLEMISRIKAVLRRAPNNSDDESILEYDGIYMNVKKREVFSNDNKVDLTYKEFELLYFLLMNRDIVLSRDKIMEVVWGFDYSGETRTVDVHIRTLRQKLGEQGDNILTIRNVGYKLGE